MRPAARHLALLLAASPLAGGVRGAEAPAPEAEELETRTVYVVELLVFAHSAGLAGSDEHWPATLDAPPWRAAVLTSDRDGSGAGDLEPAASDAGTGPDAQSDGEAEAEEGEPRDPRHVALAVTEEQRRLLEVHDRLERDPRYELLLYAAWEQEGLPQTESFQVVVSDAPMARYFMDGEELADLEQQERLRAECGIVLGEEAAADEAQMSECMAVLDIPEPEVETADCVGASEDLPATGYDGSQLGDASSDADGTACEVEPPSPFDDPDARLVGLVRMYLERFLHLQLDLTYDTGTVPDESQLLIPMEEVLAREAALGRRTVSQDLDDEDFKTDRRRGRAGERDAEPKDVDAVALDAAEPETLRVRLVESRRMRSTEVHYFDHPVLGVIATITPWEIPVAPEDQAELTADAAISSAATGG